MRSVESTLQCIQRYAVPPLRYPYQLVVETVLCSTFSRIVCIPRFPWNFEFLSLTGNVAILFPLELFILHYKIVSCDDRDTMLNCKISQFCSIYFFAIASALFYLPIVLPNFLETDLFLKWLHILRSDSCGIFAHFGVTIVFAHLYHKHDNKIAKAITSKSFKHVQKKKQFVLLLQSQRL